jgi:hypothetical protein
VQKVNQKGFGTIALVLAVLVIGATIGTGVYISRNNKRTANKDSSTQNITNFEECVAAGNPVMESFPEQCAANGETFTKDNQHNNGFNTTVASGLNAFEVTFPDGMGDIVKPLDSDSFYVMGTHQPDFKVGGSTTIKESESFGTDAPSLFSIIVHDSFSDPQGIEENYTLVNGKENPIQGKKYVKIYESDELVGIGYQRFKGDRDYEYVFPLPNGKQLRVFYSVYGVDPSNNLTTIESIIETIKIK